MERCHAGTVGVVVDGGEGGGREVDPVGVTEEERVDIRSIDDAGNDTALLVIGNEQHEAASSEPIVAKVQDVSSALREGTDETEYIIECEGPRSLDAVHDFHDAATVFQLLEDDRRIVHTFGDL